MLLSGCITNIARTSLHDGPGIRTVVYLKGCAMRCQWCHNPETISAQMEILYAETKCIHCGRCISVCPTCHRIQDDTMVFQRDSCTLCGKCIEVCPSGALTLCGKNMSVDEVMNEVRKDAVYYNQSGGGITLSGGECLLQADFCAALLEQCRAENIHTAIESALLVPWKQIEKIIPVCETYFADFKIADPQKHKQYTGQDNGLIYENLKKLVACAQKRVAVRIPLIPGVNDGPEDIAQFAKKLFPAANGLDGIEVLRYNTLAESKYIQSGRKYTDFGESQTDEALLAYCEALSCAINHRTKVFTVL